MLQPQPAAAGQRLRQTGGSLDDYARGRPTRRQRLSVGRPGLLGFFLQLPSTDCAEQFAKYESSRKIIIDGDKKKRAPTSRVPRDTIVKYDNPKKENYRVRHLVRFAERSIFARGRFIFSLRVPTNTRSYRLMSMAHRRRHNR